MVQEPEIKRCGQCRFYNAKLESEYCEIISSGWKIMDYDFHLNEGENKNKCKYYRMEFTDVYVADVVMELRNRQKAGEDCTKLEAEVDELLAYIKAADNLTLADEDKDEDD